MKKFHSRRKYSNGRRFFTINISVLMILMLFIHCKEVPQRPNILFILADDVGQEILGCYGGESYKTPNLDELAYTGMRFNHCYSMPLCSPSRTCLLTGKYPFRTGTNILEKWGTIPSNEITFAQILQNAGYKTCLSGKWQMNLLKDNPEYPLQMGFNEYFVFGWHEGPRYFDPMIYENGVAKVYDNKYGPDLFCNYIIKFMRQNKDRPFLAYYTMTLAHEISNDLIPPPIPGSDGKYQSYQELVEYMDVNIGKLVKALDELNLRKNTIIIFASDNGTPKEFITGLELSDNIKYIETPIVSRQHRKDVIGGKGLLTDGGTRVPMIINCPGTTPLGKVVDDLIDFSDFMPSLVELAGAQIPSDIEIDGHSFSPLILGQPFRPREWVFSEWNKKCWVRTQDWKLYQDGRLYDMNNDPDEKNPIGKEAAQPELVKIRTKLSTALGSLIVQ